MLSPSAPPDPAAPAGDSPLLWFNAQCQWAEARHLEVVAVQFGPDDVPRLPSYWAQGLRNAATARICPASVGDYRSVRLAARP